MLSDLFRLPFNPHLSFRPRPILHLGDEELCAGLGADKQVIKDPSDATSKNDDQLDNYFGI
jgi:hypothetical protein